MTKFVTAATAASLIAFGATMVLAQSGGTQNPNNDPRPFSQDGTNNRPYDKQSEPTNDTSGVGSRAIGPTKDEKPTDPNMPKQPEIKKLDKEGRGGQQN